MALEKVALAQLPPPQPLAHMDCHRDRPAQQHFLVPHMTKQPRRIGRSAPPDAACIDMGLPRVERLAPGQRGVGREVGTLWRGFGHGVPLGFVGAGTGEASGGEGCRTEIENANIGILVIDNRTLDPVRNRYD